MDVQGDWVLEQTMAELFKFGEMQRHMKKALKIYRRRRDVFCEMLNAEMGEWVRFKKPEGGMAVWTRFDQKIVITELAAKAKEMGLAIPSGIIYDKASAHQWNASRLVDKLLAKELVERKESAVDRRRVDVFITTKGLDLLEKASKDMDDLAHHYWEDISKKEAGQVNDLLDRLRDND